MNLILCWNSFISLKRWIAAESKHPTKKLTRQSTVGSFRLKSAKEQEADESNDFGVCLLKDSPYRILRVSQWPLQFDTLQIFLMTTVWTWSYWICCIVSHVAVFTSSWLFLQLNKMQQSWTISMLKFQLLLFSFLSTFAGCNSI